MSLDDEIRARERYSLTDGDIKHLMRGDVVVIRYTDLRNVRDLSELLGLSQNIIILFQTESFDYGHFTALWLNSRGELSFFDPYGYDIDGDLRQSRFLMHGDDVTKNSLTYLINKYLKNNPQVRLTRNRTKYQDLRIDINTCGRHCVVRLLHAEKSHEEYKRYLLGNKCGSPDVLVSLLTWIVHA